MVTSTTSNSAAMMALLGGDGRYLRGPLPYRQVSMSRQAPMAVPEAKEPAHYR